MTGAKLSDRALNRATLARQLLLDRVDMPAEQAIEHLVGVQAQAPDAAYVGLWSRLREFRTDELGELMAQRHVVRVPLMRATIHLVTAHDCLGLRPLIQPVLERSFAGNVFGRNIAAIDQDELLEAGRALVEEAPRTRVELGPLLGRRWPDVDPVSLAYAITYLLPVVQVTPRGIWGRTGPAAWTTVTHWLGTAQAPAVTVDDVVLRYLAAFGPASVKDVQSWSGLTRLRELADRLDVRRFRAEDGRELLDLPDGPLPDPQTPVPVRFLPEYDNVLLSHADRTRVITDRRAVPLPPGNGGAMGTVLLDGYFRGTWRITRQTGSATLTITPFARPSTQDKDELLAEGAELLRFAAPEGVSHDVVIIEA